MKKNINLVGDNGLADIKALVNEASKHNGRIAIISKKGYVIDAKSIMGVLSLDLPNEVTVEYDNEDTKFGEFLDKNF